MITIHSLPLTHFYIGLGGSLSPALASVNTWGELLFASGNLDNLSAACSGLSKTTVSFPVRTHVHALCAHTTFVLPSLFPLHTNLLTFCLLQQLLVCPVCTFAPSFSSFSETYFPHTHSLSLCVSFHHSFPNNSGLYPAGQSPLCGCPCRCLQ